MMSGFIVIAVSTSLRDRNESQMDKSAAKSYDSLTKLCRGFLTRICTSHERRVTATAYARRVLTLQTLIAELIANT
jgi:hypothetical protein